MGRQGRSAPGSARRQRRFDGQAVDRRPHKIGGLSIAEYMLRGAQGVSVRTDSDEDNVSGGGDR